MKLFIFPLFVILTGYMFTANIAVAHNTLTESIPADEATLTKSPESIELIFSDATYLESVELLKGDTVASLEFEKNIAASHYFNVALPSLGNGDYRVRWLVIGNDTHEIRGEFTFTALANESTE